MSDKRIYAFPGESPIGEHRGMTLRDWFAGQVLLGLVTTNYDVGNSPDPDGEYAKRAYHLAEAMMGERTETGEF